jgi:hypothetical protein
MAGRFLGTSEPQSLRTFLALEALGWHPTYKIAYGSATAMVTSKGFPCDLRGVQPEERPAWLPAVSACPAS